MLAKALLWTAAAVGLVQAKHWTVNVGKGGQLRFDPEHIPAHVGDTITYHFFARNHSVTESSFQEPCQPKEDAIFSGFVPTPDPENPSHTTFTIVVEDTKPIWLYCSQTNGNHCQSGMVHAINAPSSGNTLDAYREAAKTAKTSTSPPGLKPNGGHRVLRVEVGLNGNLTFTPNNITEIPGTTVEFSFNPKNHTVTQSSFEDPCHPLEHGFSSGFIPTSVSPSGALFDIVINDTKPIWFYCAQTTGTHCQKGMVGSINAPLTGNTLEAFIGLASKASPSTIPPQAPLGGILTVNGTIVPTLKGNVLDATALDGDTIKYIPKPGENNQYMMGMAGGGGISNYNWPPSMSDNATYYLQTMQWLDDILLTALFSGYEKLNGGQWANIYPKTIVKSIGAMAAQAYVHRSTATDSLQHYNKPTAPSCSYQLPIFAVDDLIHVTLTLLNLHIGLILDAMATLAVSDPWLVPCLATSLGAKSRMSAVINLMQNHIAAAAPREVALPAPMVWSYATNNYNPSCGNDAPKLPWGNVLPPLKITAKNIQPGSKRPITITLSFDTKLQGQGQLWVAWLGPWGEVKYTPLGGDGTAPVPTDLYGHVWVVLTNAQGPTKLKEVVGITIAGPEMIWIAQP